MGILLTLVTLIIGISIPVGILFFTGFDLINFSLMFVVPVGAIITGYVCGFGFYKSLVRSHKKIVFKHHLLASLLALICMFSILYSEYYLTQVDLDGNAVYALSGDHISNYEVDGYGQMTFINYTKFNIETSVVSFSRRARSLGEVSNVTLNYIFFIVNIVGLVGGFLAVGFSKSNAPYCDSCQKYKKVNQVRAFSKDKMNETIEQLEALANDLKHDELIAFIESLPEDSNIEKAPHIALIIEYCEDHRHGEMALVINDLDKDGKLDVTGEFERRIALDTSVCAHFA